MEEEMKKVADLEAAMQQVAEANTAMVKAIKGFVRNHLSENERDVKVTFRQRINNASCDAIIGLTYDYKEDNVVFNDDGGCDVDEGDMTANELYDICGRLCDVFGDKHKGSAYAFELL